MMCMVTCFHMPAPASNRQGSETVLTPTRRQARPQLEEGKGKEADGSTCTWQRAQHGEHGADDNQDSSWFLW